MNISVVKFGGSSFPTLASYREIAAKLIERLARPEDRVVVVVSAMSGTTGKLLEAGTAIDPAISPEITDSLLGTGEMVAACLMRAAIEALGASATQLTGYQLGWVTTSQYTRAKPLELGARALREALRDHRIVVVAGGQAVDARGRLTMLGRNSSDLSAVLVASALGIDECEIFSDVPGVYSADPYAIEDARLLPRVPFDAIIGMSRAGAKVLHHGAVSYAKLNGVRIVCRGTADGRVGSVIGAGACPDAVVSSDKFAALEFDSAADRDAAHASLEAAGIVSLPVELTEGHWLAVSRENRAWMEAVAALPQKHRAAEGLGLLTLQLRTGALMHQLVPAQELLERSRSAHRRAYGGRTGPEARRRLPSKTRSAQSGLLVTA